MEKISIAKAKAQFAELVASAESGDRVVITRNGRPVAELGPLPPAPAVQFDDLADMGIQLDNDLSLPEHVLRDFEADGV